MAATLRDVAARAGVSPGTVSRVLTNAGYVRSTTRERILAVIAELDYRPSLLASTLRNNRSQTVGILTERPLVYEYVALALTGILEQLSADSLGALISEVDSSEAVRHVMNQFQRRQVDGIIYIGSGFPPAASITVAGWAPPHVYLFTQPDLPDGPVVLADDAQGATIGTQHLLDLGHRRIAFIGASQRSRVAQKRLLGYCQALEMSGLPASADLIRSGSWAEEHGFTAIFDLSATKVAFTAVFAANDFIATGVLHALQATGRRVPDDVAVLGFDNHTIATMTRPRLSTLELPAREMGRAAAKLLTSQVATDRQTKDWIDHTFPYRLIVRDSTPRI